MPQGQSAREYLYLLYTVMVCRVRFDATSRNSSSPTRTFVTKPSRTLSPKIIIHIDIYYYVYSRSYENDVNARKSRV